MEYIYNKKYGIKMLEIDYLREWFNDEYSYNEQKYRRLIALNKLCDDGSNPSTKLTELYLVAEEKRKRIQELEKTLKE